MQLLLSPNNINNIALVDESREIHLYNICDNTVYYDSTIPLFPHNKTISFYNSKSTTLQSQRKCNSVTSLAWAPQNNIPHKATESLYKKPQQHSSTPFFTVGYDSGVILNVSPNLNDYTQDVNVFSDTLLNSAHLHHQPDTSYHISHFSTQIIPPATPNFRQVQFNCIYAMDNAINNLQYNAYHSNLLATTSLQSRTQPSFIIHDIHAALHTGTLTNTQYTANIFDPSHSYANPTSQPTSYYQEPLISSYFPHILSFSWVPNQPFSGVLGCSKFLRLVDIRAAMNSNSQSFAQYTLRTYATTNSTISIDESGHYLATQSVIPGEIVIYDLRHFTRPIASNPATVPLTTQSTVPASTRAQVNQTIEPTTTKIMVDPICTIDTHTHAFIRSKPIQQLQNPAVAGAMGSFSHTTHSMTQQQSVSHPQQTTVGGANLKDQFYRQFFFGRSNPSAKVPSNNIPMPNHENKIKAQHIGNVTAPPVLYIADNLGLCAYDLSTPLTLINSPNISSHVNSNSKNNMTPHNLLKSGGSTANTTNTITQKSSSTSLLQYINPVMPSTSQNPTTTLTAVPDKRDPTADEHNSDSIGDILDDVGSFTYRMNRHIIVPLYFGGVNVKQHILHSTSPLISPYNANTKNINQNYLYNGPLSVTLSSTSSRYHNYRSYTISFRTFHKTMRFSIPRPIYTSYLTPYQHQHQHQHQQHLRTISPPRVPSLMNALFFITQYATSSTHNLLLQLDSIYNYLAPPYLNCNSPPNPPLSPSSTNSYRLRQVLQLTLRNIYLALPQLSLYDMPLPHNFSSLFALSHSPSPASTSAPSVQYHPIQLYTIYLNIIHHFNNNSALLSSSMTDNIKSYNYSHICFLLKNNDILTHAMSLTYTIISLYLQIHFMITIVLRSHPQLRVDLKLQQISMNYPNQPLQLQRENNENTNQTQPFSTILDILSFILNFYVNMENIQNVLLSSTSLIPQQSLSQSHDDENNINNNNKTQSHSHYFSMSNKIINVTSHLLLHYSVEYKLLVQIIFIQKQLGLLFNNINMINIVVRKCFYAYSYLSSISVISYGSNQPGDNPLRQYKLHLIKYLSHLTKLGFSPVVSPQTVSSIRQESLQLQYEQQKLNQIALSNNNSTTASSATSPTSGVTPVPLLPLTVINPEFFPTMYYLVLGPKYFAMLLNTTVKMINPNSSTDHTFVPFTDNSAISNYTYYHPFRQPFALMTPEIIDQLFSTVYPQHFFSSFPSQSNPEQSSNPIALAKEPFTHPVIFDTTRLPRQPHSAQEAREITLWMSQQSRFSWVRGIQYAAVLHTNVNRQVGRGNTHFPSVVIVLCLLSLEFDAANGFLTGGNTGNNDVGNINPIILPIHTILGSLKQIYHSREPSLANIRQIGSSIDYLLSIQITQSGVSQDKQNIQQQQKLPSPHIILILKVLQLMTNLMLFNVNYDIPSFTTLLTSITSVLPPQLQLTFLFSYLDDKSLLLALNIITTYASKAGNLQYACMFSLFPTGVGEYIDASILQEKKQVGQNNTLNTIQSLNSFSTLSPLHTQFTTILYNIFHTTTVPTNTMVKDSSFPKCMSYFYPNIDVSNINSNLASITSRNSPPITTTSFYNYQSTGLYCQCKSCFDCLIQSYAAQTQDVFTAALLTPYLTDAMVHAQFYIKSNITNMTSILKNNPNSALTLSYTFINTATMWTKFSLLSYYAHCKEKLNNTRGISQFNSMIRLIDNDIVYNTIVKSISTHPPHPTASDVEPHPSFTYQKMQTLDTAYCTACGRLLTPDYFGNPKGSNNRMGKSEFISCSQCQSTYPLCIVCLEPALSKTSIDEAKQASPTQKPLVAWCILCKHGGHLEHIKQWQQFSKHCAKSDCNCICAYNAASPLG